MNGLVMKHSTGNGHDGANVSFSDAIGVMASRRCMSYGLAELGQV